MGHAEAGAGAWGAVVGVEDDGGGVGEAEQRGRALGHDLAVDVGDGEAVLGVGDSGGEEAVAVEGTVALVECEPAGDVAGHEGGEDAGVAGLLGEGLGDGGEGGPAGEVEGPDTALLGDVGEGEADASDAGHVGLDDVKRSGGGDGGVEGVAAVNHDGEASLRGEWVGRGDHAVGAHGDGPARRRVEMRPRHGGQVRCKAGLCQGQGSLRAYGAASREVLGWKVVPFRFISFHFLAGAGIRWTGLGAHPRYEWGGTEALLGRNGTAIRAPSASAPGVIRLVAGVAMQE